jgi:hypothetical protein
MSSQPQVSLESELGLAEIPASRDDVIDAMMPRFVFSPFLTLLLDSERIKPRLIMPARITVLLPFYRHERNFEFLRESEAISRDESMSANEFEDRLVRPGDVVKTLKNIFATSGSVPTGFIELGSLQGREPDKRREDKDLLLRIQNACFPQEPADGYHQMEMLEEAAQAVDDALSLQVVNALIESTSTAIAFCNLHIAGTEAELERAAAGGENAKGNKIMLSSFDRQVCDWIRRPYPKITSKLTYEQLQPAALPAPTALDPSVLGQAIAGSMPAIIAGLREAGLLAEGKEHAGSVRSQAARPHRKKS